MGAGRVGVCRVAILGVTTVLPACPGGTVPLQSPAVTGVYALERVNDDTLPARATATSCPLTITDGELSIAPQTAETQQLYVLLVHARRACDSFLDRPAPDEFARDFGDWHQRNTGLEFTSRNGRGTYRVQIGVAGGRPTATLTLDERSYRWRFARSDAEPIIPMSVSVVDTIDRAVDGVYLEIRAANGLIARGVTNGGRPFLTGASAGRATIRVAPPAPYAVATGQENPMTASVVLGRETRVRIVLGKRIR